MALEIREWIVPNIENDSTEVYVLFKKGDQHSDFDKSDYQYLKGTVKEIALHIIGMTTDDESKEAVYLEFAGEFHSSEVLEAICDSSIGAESFEILYL